MLQTGAGYCLHQGPRHGWVESIMDDPLYSPRTLEEGGRIPRPRQLLLPLRKPQLPLVLAALLASRSVFISGKFASNTIACAISATTACADAANAAANSALPRRRLRRP